MRKERLFALGAVAAAAGCAFVGMVVYVVANGGAGAALTICLVGLGPALAAIALVAALSATAPAATVQAPAVAVSSAEAAKDSVVS